MIQKNILQNESNLNNNSKSQSPRNNLTPSKDDAKKLFIGAIKSITTEGKILFYLNVNR